jgi:predicted nucleotidyltransferase
VSDDLSMHVLLSGIVGSTAYGLAGPDSDVDRLGMFAAPTVAFHGLHQPKATHTTTAPDAIYHEAAKYARLALSGNPTVSDLMWLPDDLYEVRTPLGDELIGIRAAFLCAKRTRDAHLGYAASQFHRLASRGDGSFSADTRKRTAKHARHLMRLCHQGLGLYRTGELRIRLEDPEEFIVFGERVAAGDIEAARALIGDYEKAFDESRTALPDRPDEAAVEAWLLRVRAAHYKAAVS